MSNATLRRIVLAITLVTCLSSVPPASAAGTPDTGASAPSEGALQLLWDFFALLWPASPAGASAGGEPVLSDAGAMIDLNGRH